MVTAPIKFKLIRAENRHLEDLFRLANDPVVRAVSINKNNIAWPDHVDWFQKKINDPNCILFIIETPEGQFIGQIRFDISDEEAVVNISLMEYFRSRGVARPALIQAGWDLFAARPELNTITAYIRLDNKNSKNLFEKCGYTYIGIVDITNDKYYKYAFTGVK